VTYREAVYNGTLILEAAGVDDPIYDARELLCAAAGIDAAAYALRIAETLPEQVHSLYRSYLSRRAQREPLQRILGYAWFMGERYALNEATLIPRFDSEILVLEAAKEAGLRPGRCAVLDIGTGTGCLLIALLKRRTDLLGTATDISERALEAARVNAGAMGVSARFVRSDLFSNVTDSYDIIMSNPPYIPGGEIAALDKEVRDFDPKTALDGGEDGLEIYRRLIADAPVHLNAGGQLMLEIGCSQAADVSALMAQERFSGIKTVKDLSGHDRVVTGSMEL